MRFGKTLAASLYPPWKDYYIDYARLKTLLREKDTSPQREWTEQDEEDFVHELINVQLDKVHHFHVETYTSLRIRTAASESKLEPVAITQSENEDASEEHRRAVQEVMKELDSISKDIERLQTFSRINFTGFLKAAKKHDRKRGRRYRVQPILQVRLSQVSFHSEDYTPLLHRLSAMYTFCHHILQIGQRDRHGSVVSIGRRETYSAHKFWVHPDNLLEVKTMILRRLPVLIYHPQSLKVIDSTQKDPSITSIYFDNPKFELYSQKVDKAAEASSLRLRWTGQLKEKPIIHLEKKTVQDGAESKEIKVPIKEKYIQSFLKGEYRLEKSVQKLADRYGPDSEQVRSMQSNIDEIQEFIHERRLEPVLRASYTRAAFQIPGDDRIRVSLDTNLALIREDALDEQRPCRDLESWHRTDIDGNQLEFPYSSINKGEISRFPHALLEIKIRDSKATRNNTWLSDLMSSHLVKEAPLFSKFAHGIAQLFEDQVNSFPFWLSDLDTDIRRDPEIAFQEEQQKQAQKAEDEIAVGSFLPGSRLSSSAAAAATFKTKIGSPHKFSPETEAATGGLSQSIPPSQPSPLRLPLDDAAGVGGNDNGDGKTAHERDGSGSSSGINNNNNNNIKNKNYSSSPRHLTSEAESSLPNNNTATADPTTNRGLRALFPSFSNSRYARRHQPHNASSTARLQNDPASSSSSSPSSFLLPPGISPPSRWLKDSGPVRVEAKVWLANQRTFIKWQHITILLASLSLGLYNAAAAAADDDATNGVDSNVKSEHDHKDHRTDVARALALVYTAFAAFAAVWGWGVYIWRSRLIRQRSGKDFDCMAGPMVVSVGLVVALVLNFGLRYYYHYHSHSSEVRVGDVSVTAAAGS